MGDGSSDDRSVNVTSVAVYELLANRSEPTLSDLSNLQRIPAHSGAIATDVIPFAGSVETVEHPNGVQSANQSALVLDGVLRDESHLLLVFVVSFLN